MPNISFLKIWTKIKSSKYLQIGILLFVFGITLLLLSVDKSETEKALSTEEELKSVLEQIEGVGETEVMIYEDDSGIQGVLVLSEGATDPTKKIIIRQAVSTSLNIDKQKIRIYEKKSK